MIRIFSTAAAKNRAFVPSRTYREELYSARRVTIDPRGANSLATGGLKADSLGRGLGMFKGLMDRDNIRGEVKARQFFLKPCRQNLLDLFKKQEGKFNAMVRRNIELIKEVELANK